MVVYFGSETVAEEVAAVLMAIPAVTAVVDGRVLNLSVAPEGYDLPAVLHYMETGTYAGPIAGYSQTHEVLRYVVRFLCNGASTDPIRTAAEAAYVLLDGHTAERAGAHLNFNVSGEWPLTTVLEGGTLYRQLGVFLDVDMTQGG